MDMTIADALRLKNQQGLSVAHISSSSGVDEVIISRILRGSISRLRPVTLARLTEFLRRDDAPKEPESKERQIEVTKQPTKKSVPVLIPTVRSTAEQDSSTRNKKRLNFNELRMNNANFLKDSFEDRNALPSKLLENC